MSIIEHILGVLCHQLPERSQNFDSCVFPLCFRCAGLYIGIFISYFHLLISGCFRRSISYLREGKIIFYFTLPLILDGLGNAFSLWSSPKYVRFLTGFIMGITITLFLLSLMKSLKSNISAMAIHFTTFLKTILFHLVFGFLILELLINPMLIITFHILSFAAMLGFLLFLMNCLFIFLYCHFLKIS